MDDPDIPMLDVGDFEVLDECAGEEDNEDHDNDQDEVISCGSNIERDMVNVEEVDDNSVDNGDNILDVSIDVSENDFLESVAKDFSENIEDDDFDRPRTRASARKSQASTKKEPKLQIKRMEVNSKQSANAEEPIVIKKKPGPKSKTMIVQTPAKKPIQKINFSDEKENDKDDKQKENQKNTTEEPQKNQQDTQTTTPAFLKKDLTDEEIMIHFDEIENTVLTSETFIIQNDVDHTETEVKDKEVLSDEQKNEKKDDKQEGNEEENWDDEEPKGIKRPHIKIEEEEFKGSEMWYKDKIKEKERIVEEKFTKLAKIIQYSYPMYKKWLDRNESMFGTAICKVESSKHSPLDQVFQTRWKFICNKKQTQQPSKEEEKEGDNASKDKSTQSNWQVIPGVPDANLENTEDYPPYVMRVVKIFEEFLQSLDESKSSNETFEESKEDAKGEAEDSESKTENKNEDTEGEKEKEKADENEKSNVKILEGLSLLIRSNRKQELMMHITGKSVTSELLDKIKDLFENGAGKDSNVKSLYCKSIIKEDNVIKTSNMFLCGSETLDDNIGSVKVQLAPKATIWANLAGVEVLANVVSEYLNPTKNTTILEIGCGTGLISLLLASKCQKVIGIDVQKEIVEAEHTCEINEIKNATFLTGKPKIIMTQIEKSLVDSKAVAVVNTNNAFGRSIEIINALRKINTLGRIVIITTLTKQAIRSILELTQPADDVYGNPFIPIKACIVDTTPKSYGFDIVMSMERRTMRNLLKASPGETIINNPVGLISKSKQVAALKYGTTITTGPPFKKNPPLKFIKNFKGKPTFIAGKKFFPNPAYNPASKFQSKRPFPGSDSSFHPGAKKFKQFDKTWIGPNIRNPLLDKKLRDMDQGDLREKLSSNRVEPTAIAHEMQEQKKLLDAAKEKLTGAGSGVDVDTVKKLQEMLNLAIEKTNKLQSQLPPRSVWDRIAPADSGMDDTVRSNAPMRGRLVKERGPREIIITARNDKDFETPSASGKNRKYVNLPPLEPDIMPLEKPERLKMSQSVIKKPNTAPYQKPGPNRYQSKNFRASDNQSSDSWSRGKQQSVHSQNESHNRWSRPSPPRRSYSPRPVIRSPPRQSSPPRRPISPSRRPMSPPRRPLSPPRRPTSPNFRQHSSSSRGASSSGRQSSPTRRHSPPRRPSSPHNYRGGSPPRHSNSSSRPKSPARRYADEWDIPSRGAITEDTWSREKDKSSWQPPTSVSSTSGWNQQNSNNSNRYRSENDKWDNPSGGSSWASKSQAPASNPSSRWKSVPSSISNNSNWDVQKKESSMRDTGRHEVRHESRHDSRHEPRWETQEKSYRNDKEDWNDLPEDARDPWGDDHPSNSQKEIRWNSQTSQSQAATSGWSREKPNSDSWQTKSNFSMNSIAGASGGSGMNPNISNMSMPMNMNMNMGINNPSKSMWQSTQQPSRNTNWLQSGNWQGAGGGSGGGGGNGGGMGLTGLGLGAGGNGLNNWQQPQQNFSNIQSRSFHNNPYMNNRR